MSGDLQDLREVRREVDARIQAARALESGGALVANGHDLRILEAGKVANDVRTPVTVADDAYSNNVGGGLGLVLDRVGLLRTVRLDRAGRFQDGHTIAGHSQLLLLR